MSKQSEAILEEQLVAQLQLLGYKYALINSEKEPPNQRLSKSLFV